MKAASPSGGGTRGRPGVAIAIVAALLLSVALVLGGCGDSDEKSSTGSQLDEESVTTGDNVLEGVGSAGGTTPADDEEVMVGYSWGDCITEMTARYGSEDAARRVCDVVRTEYSSLDRAALDNVLPEVEKKAGVPSEDTPQPPPAGGGTQTQDDGWGGIEIIVPPAP